MGLQWVQKVIFMGMLTLIAWFISTIDREAWNTQHLKDMLGSRRISLKLFSFATGFAILTGAILVPFSNSWLEFIIGCFLYWAGIKGQEFSFDLSEKAWSSEKS